MEGVPMELFGLGRKETKLLPLAVGAMANALGTVTEVPKSAMRAPLPEVFATTHQVSSVTSKFVSNKCPVREIQLLWSEIVTMPFAKTKEPTTVPFEPLPLSIMFASSKLYRWVNTGGGAAETITVAVAVTLRNAALMFAEPTPAAVTRP